MAYFVDSSGHIRDDEEVTLSGRRLYQCGYGGANHHHYGQYEEQERIIEFLNK